jgi:Fe-S cluster biogenesis protein NfuA/nitrite reductase/ring-hydroxylating ferredoxin subunit
MAGVHDVGTRVEQLIADFAQARDRARAEELVRLVVGLYGEGLERIASLLARRDPDALAELAGDELISGLLLVHGLHPQDVDSRIQQALDSVRPYLGSHAGGVEYLGVDADGVAHLRLAGTCNGCPSSMVTVRTAIEGAIEKAAPEVVAVDVEGVSAPAPASSQERQLLQIGRPPSEASVVSAMSEVGAASQASQAPGVRLTDAAWTSLPQLGPPTSRPTVLELDGTRVLICTVRGTLYAYRDSCAVCDASLGEARLDQGRLTCPACGTSYDVRLAGKGVDDPSRHLDPLPLINDSQGVRVAVPVARAVAP